MKEMSTFTLPLIANVFGQTLYKKINLACWCGLVPTRPSQALLLPSPSATNTNDKKKLKKTTLSP
jgi:hypothetical protein